MCQVHFWFSLTKGMNQSNEGKEEYSALLNLLGCTEEELPPWLVFDYVTRCSEFRERLVDGEPRSQCFFYSISSTEFVHFWPTFYYRQGLQSPRFYDDYGDEDSEGEEENFFDHSSDEDE